MVTTNDLTIIKSINNNVLLVRDEIGEKVLIEKGIGFGKALGGIIKKGTEVQKIYVMSTETEMPEFNKFINTVDNKLIQIFEELLNKEFNDKIYIGLIDHLSSIINKLQNDQKIINPFFNEVEPLYGKEFELATKVAIKIEEEIGVRIPDSEIVFIAIYIHSSKNIGKLSNTEKYSDLYNTIIQYVEEELNIDIDRQSLDCTRFLIHIKFTIERIISNKKIENDIKNIIKEEYKLSYKISEDIAKVISTKLDCVICEDEIAYIAIHIERFRKLLG